MNPLEPSKRRRGRPEIPASVRARIIQIRTSNPDRPPGYDRILKQLTDEGVDPLPSRGTVQNIVTAWNELDPEIRLRDLAFRWHLLEDAEIPWEASDWTLICKATYESFYLGTAARQAATQPEDSTGPLFRLAPFTNRWAKWCWRVHLANPQLVPPLALGVAFKYAIEEQAHDLLPRREMDVEPMNGWLTYRPYVDQGFSEIYQDALRFGTAQPFLDMTEDLKRDLELLNQSPLPPNERIWSLGWLLARHAVISDQPGFMTEVLESVIEQIQQQMATQDSQPKRDEGGAANEGTH